MSKYKSAALRRITPVFRIVQLSIKFVDNCSDRGVQVYRAEEAPPTSGCKGNSKEALVEHMIHWLLSGEANHVP